MFTYFIKNNVNSLVKIGKASKVERRINEIAGQCSFVKLSVFHVIDGDVESFYHRLYKDFRKEGEWFDMPELTIEKINSDLKGFVAKKRIDSNGVEYDCAPNWIDTFLSKHGDTDSMRGFLMTLMTTFPSFYKEMIEAINDIQEEVISFVFECYGCRLMCNRVSHFIEAVPSMPDDFAVVKAQTATRTLKITVTAK